MKSESQKAYNPTFLIELFDSFHPFLNFTFIQRLDFYRFGTPGASIHAEHCTSGHGRCAAWCGAEIHTDVNSNHSSVTCYICKMLCKSFNFPDISFLKCEKGIIKKETRKMKMMMKTVVKIPITTVNTDSAFVVMGK